MDPLITWTVLFDSYQVLKNFTFNWVAWLWIVGGPKCSNCKVNLNIIKLTVTLA